MERVIVALIVFLSSSIVSEAGTIQGRIAQLDGTPIDELRNFQVMATNGNRQVGIGSTVNGTVRSTDSASRRPTFVLAPVRSQGPPLQLDYIQFRVEIDDAALLAQDKRITLTFRATGRENVTLFGVAGNLDQSIDVIMPVAQGTSNGGCSGTFYSVPNYSSRYKWTKCPCRTRRCKDDD